MSGTEDEWYIAALRLVDNAGYIVRNAFNLARPMQVDTKTSDIDLVTESDKAVENLLCAGIQSQFSGHKFIGEESTQKAVLTNAPTWIIDPIDGTTNFVHRFPHIAICVGLYVDKKPRFGIVYNPVSGELYSARKGQGAFLNGFPIKASKTTDLTRALVAITFGSDRTEDGINGYLENMRNVLKHGIRGQRSLGSAALNMCAVAAGRLDVYMEFGPHCWDWAAAGLILEEAGGVLLDSSGGPFDLMARNALGCATPELAKQVSAFAKDPVKNRQRDDA